MTHRRPRPAVQRPVDLRGLRSKRRRAATPDTAVVTLSPSGIGLRYAPRAVHVRDQAPPNRAAIGGLRARFRCVLRQTGVCNDPRLREIPKMTGGRMGSACRIAKRGGQTPASAATARRFPSDRPSPRGNGAAHSPDTPRIAGAMPFWATLSRIETVAARRTRFRPKPRRTLCPVTPSSSVMARRAAPISAAQRAPPPAAPRWTLSCPPGPAAGTSNRDRSPAPDRRTQKNIEKA